MQRGDAWVRELARCYFDPSRKTGLRLDDDLNPKDATAENWHDMVVIQALRLVDQNPEECWRFIGFACEMQLSREQLGLLGAGIFEDLMDDHGLQFIDRVEAAIKFSPNVRAMVDAVWTNNMDQSVVRAIKAIKSSHR